MVRGRRLSAVAVLFAAAVGPVAGQDRPTIPSVLPAPVPSVLPASASEPKMIDLTPPELAKPHGGHGAGHGGGEYPPAAGCTTCAPKHGHGEHEDDLTGKWFGTGEFLIWRPRLDSLDYAVVDPVNNLTPQGRVKNLQYDARGGFRVGVGYRVPEQGWDFGLTYTYFNSTGAESVAAPAGGVIYPTLTRPGVVDRVSTASVTGGLDYSVFDADLGRTWEVDEHLTLRAFGGVRFARLGVDQTATYDGIHATQDRVSNRSTFRGTGPTVGTEARWNVCHAVSLFGNVRGGLLYGDFEGTTNETNGAGSALNADLEDKFSGVAPFAAVQLGGAWTWRTITLAAGYEVTHYFNMVTQPKLVDDFAEGKTLRRRGDLSFDGVFFRVGLAY